MKHALGLALLIVSAPAAVGQTANMADVMPPPPPGYVGTAFRGLALGQSRIEAEAALKAIGYRCAVDAELPNDPFLVASARTIANDPLQTCWMVSDTPELSTTEAQQLAGAVNVGKGFFFPFRAVWFVEGRATQFGLDFAFFNAPGMSAYDVAASLVDNYDFPNGMQLSGSAYTGLTSKSEKVGVAATTEWKVVSVSYVGGGGTPTFN